MKFLYFCSVKFKFWRIDLERHTITIVDKDLRWGREKDDLNRREYSPSEGEPLKDKGQTIRGKCGNVSKVGKTFSSTILKWLENRFKSDT